jgi:N6-adenosine-specific RNA methylase IME4
VSHLPASWGTLYEMTRLNDEQFKAKVADGTIRPDVERNEITSLIGARNATSRRSLAQQLSNATSLKPSGRKFPVVYADPAWSRKAGIGDRAYENTYLTMSWDDILAMPVAQRMLPDAWLYLWIPRAHLLALHPTEIDTPLGRCKIKLPLAWAVAQAWGFDAYSTCFIWTKTDEEMPDDHGLGLIAWDQDEVLCLFKRGNGLPKPDSGKKHGSNHRERAAGHSAKPTYYRDMINDMTGGVPVLELFAREDEQHVLPTNFFTWGNQSKGTADRCADDGSPTDQETGEIIGEAAE